MSCSNCGNPYSLDDNFCRKCGASLRDVRVPAARDSSQLPVAWRSAMPVVVQGAALVALGAAAQLLLRLLARRALRLPALLLRPPPKKKAGQLPVRKDEEEPSEVAYAVRETFLLRRIILRR